MVEFSARDPENLSLEEVEVRLVRPDERAETLVRENHYLEFKRFAGRGWRYALTWPLAGTCGLANRCVQVPAAELDPRDPVSPSASQQHPLRVADEAAHAQQLFVQNRPSDDGKLIGDVSCCWLKRLPSRFEDTVYKAGDWIHV